MKIISKYKDYYDYLQGIYGVDNKLILDRREYDTYTPTENEKLIFYIGGYIIEGLWKNNKCYYGNDLLQFKTQPKYYYLFKPKSEFSVNIGDTIFSTIIEKDNTNINEKENCPILLKYNKEYLHYIKLDQFNLASFIPAEEIYTLIVNWISLQLTKKEQIKEVDDKLKIVNKGFDLKYSFRPKMR